MSAGIIDGQRVVRPFLSRLGTFPSPVVSRPPMLGVHAVMGNFVMSFPLHELNDTRYPVVPIADLTLDNFDAEMFPAPSAPGTAWTRARQWSCAGAPPRPARWWRASPSLTRAQAISLTLSDFRESMGCSA